MLRVSPWSMGHGSPMHALQALVPRGLMWHRRVVALPWGLLRAHHVSRQTKKFWGLQLVVFLGDSLGAAFQNLEELGRGTVWGGEGQDWLHPPCRSVWD